MFTVSIEGSLSASTLECLLKCTDPNLQSKEIALPFDSLLIGWPDEKVPIQIIHQSLREILTCAKSKFSINEKEHSQRLALCCLSILGRTCIRTFLVRALSMAMKRVCQRCQRTRSQRNYDMLVVSEWTTPPMSIPWTTNSSRLFKSSSQRSS